jgi:hypothetical protein
LVAKSKLPAKFVRQLSKNKLNSIPYFTRMIIVDRVGVEPTTSAKSKLCRISFVVQSYE